MKKIILLLIGIVFSITIISAQAAPPQEFSYKATIIKSNGAIVANKTISLRISILQGSTSGGSAYTETFHPTTNAYGQIDIVIGGSTGLPYIDWSNSSYFLKTEFDDKGGTSYQLMSIVQLLSVPYALFAGGADYNHLINKPTKLSQFSNNVPFLSIETDPIFSTHPAHGIEGSDIANWTNAYGWGDHALAGYALLSNVYTRSDLQTAGNSQVHWNNLTNKPAFASIATTGDYNDLINKPTSLGTSWNSITSKPATVSGYSISDAVTTTDDQTITGIKTFSNDLLVNGLTVGKGINSLDMNTAIGNAALSTTTGDQNTAVGFQTLLLNTTGSWNTANGAFALRLNTTGQSNTAIGGEALGRNQTGSHNTATGFRALRISTGDYNTANGSNALSSNTDGNSNTAIGIAALSSNTTGNDNTAIGYFSLWENISGSGNTATGEMADFSNTSGSQNTADGYSALLSNKEGSQNTALGYGADVSAPNLTNATAIGANAKVNASNTFVFGNNEVVGWGFGVSPGTEAIRVGTTTNNGNGATLTLTGVWTNSSDISKKYEIENINYGLGEVMKLHPVTYKLKGTNNQDIGFIAQEVKKVIPEIIYGKEGEMTMSYDQLTSVLVKAIQEQQRQIEELKDLVKSFSGLVNK